MAIHPRRRCNGKLTYAMTGEVNLKKLIELIIRGGWPGSIGLPIEQASLLPEEYLNAVIDDDVYRIDGIKRDTSKPRLFIIDNQPLFAAGIRSSPRSSSCRTAGCVRLR